MNDINNIEEEEKYVKKSTTTTITKPSNKRRRKRYSSTKIIIILRLSFVIFILDYMLVDNYILMNSDNNIILVKSSSIIDNIDNSPTTTNTTIKKTMENFNVNNNVNSKSSTSSSGDDGVVLMGILCHPKQKKIRSKFRRQSKSSRFLLHNNNNNNNSNTSTNNNEVVVVVCSLGTYYYLQQKQQHNRKCKLVYTFVIFGKGGGGGGGGGVGGGAIVLNESNISEDGKVLFKNRTTAIMMAPAPANENDDDIVFLDIPNKKVTKSQRWLKYVSSTIIMEENFDYVAKMELLQPPTTTTTTTTTNDDTLLVLDFDRYFQFAASYLHPIIRPSYNNNNNRRRRTIVGRFTNYLFCEWPSHIDKIPSNQNKPKPNNKGTTIHFYTHKQFWILSTDLVKEYNNNQQTTFLVGELSEYWKHRNLAPESMSSCIKALEDYELSTYAFQYNNENNLPLNLIPISEQYKFWMKTTKINKPSSSSSSSSSSPSSSAGAGADAVVTTPNEVGTSNNNNNNSNNAAAVTTTSSSQPSPSSSSKQRRQKQRSVVLMGIFCQFQDKVFRDMFRSLFKIRHPKVCSLGTYKQQQQQQQMTSYKKHGVGGGEQELNGFRPSSPSSSCEFIYAFVIGANTTNSTTTPTERVTGSLDEIIIPTPMMMMMMNHSSNYVMLMDEDEIKTMHDDLIFLNIRENMNEGKSTTWLYVASQIAKIYLNNDIDYIGKMDTDTLIYFDRYFDFASDYLPPAPYNQRKLISVFADKSWWGYNKPFMYMGREHSYTSEKESYFKYHYPGSSSSDPITTKFGIHIHAQGQMYILSQDLAMGVTEIAHLASSSSVPSNNKYNYYRNHLETIEDHDVSTLAYLWLAENPLNHILIEESNKFWDHGGRLKRSRKQRWEMVWNDEINRMKNITLHN